MFHLRADAQDAPDEFTAETTVLADEAHGLVEADQGDVGFVDLDAGLHRLIGPHIHHPLCTGALACTGMQLEHNTIQGRDQLTEHEVGLKPFALRQGLIPLSLKTHQLFTLVVHQSQFGRTPIGGSAEALYLKGLKLYLLIEAAQLRIDALQISEESIPVIEGRQHLAGLDQITLIHIEGCHPGCPRHPRIGSRQIADVPGGLQLPQGRDRFGTNRGCRRRFNRLGFGRRPQQPAADDRNDQTSSQNRPALGGHQSSGGLSNRSMSM